MYLNVLHHLPDPTLLVQNLQNRAAKTCTYDERFQQLSMDDKPVRIFVGIEDWNGAASYPFHRHHMITVAFLSIVWAVSVFLVPGAAENYHNSGAFLPWLATSIEEVQFLLRAQGNKN
ncbi:uncharacterized protein ARMOST_13040 [Armillaria ostoyae]|uniref:Uncharacterized protein n=1 Tax=Armillaria ostoyae TaxID=47428 RepID=A0A284RLN4_ARMOS|nr:uncharacterized protein ARMOST_13040 [Armillaria ostoyae]